MNERELKFRIWVHIDKAFHYFDIYEYPSGIAMGVSHPMQFTGMKDSKGNDIYEGDILEYFEIGLNGDRKITALVEFRDCKFGCQIWSHFCPMTGIPHPKVIGNIIEHKHLLT